MIHPKMKYVYVGIDSHKDTHCAVILNCFFEKLGEITFGNAPSEFEKFLSEAEKRKLEGTKLAFGLEDISAYGRALTVFLTDRKLVVKHVNSSLVASERKSRNILHKTDSVDAECAARILLSRFDTLPDADPQDKYWVLKNLVIRRRSIINMNVALKNHVQSNLLSHYPSYSKFFFHFDCKSSLAFFAKYPSPSTLAGVTEEELDAFLKEVSEGKQYHGKAQKILEMVKKDGDTTCKYQPTRDMVIKSSLSQISSNLKEIQSINRILEEFLDNFDYKLQTLTGVDYITAAELIAEIGDISRFQTPSKLARYAGIAPVTYSSGKTDVQYSNQRGNRALNAIFHRIALVVVSTAGKKKILNPFFYHYFHKKVSEGKTKRQALKCVQRRLVNIVWSMMVKKMEYINPPQEDYKEKENMVQSE